MLVLDIYIALHLAGVLTWQLFANFGTPIWDTSYFIWETLLHGSIMGWACFLILGPVEIKRRVFPVFLYSIFRMLVEVAAAIWKFDINNEWSVMVLFLIAISVTSYMSYRPGGFLPKWFNNVLNL